MMIECTTRRIGWTPVDIGKVKYRFQPPDPMSAKRGEWTTSICDVTSDEHIKWLMARKNFREYDEERTRKEQMDWDKNAAVYNGFSIRKHTDGRNEGYVVFDMRDKEHPRYAGLDQIWLDKLQGIKMWVHEIDAWEWLKDEARELAKEAEEEKKQATLRAKQDRSKVIQPTQ